MQILKQVIGIDVSKGSLSIRFGTLDSEQNQKIYTPVNFPNNLDGHKKLLSWALKQKISEQAPMWFVMEATGVYYENLAFFLSEKKQNIAVILPNKAKNFSRTLDIKSKTDLIDAASLTQFGLEKQLKAWHNSPEMMRKLKALCREYHNLKELAVQVSNQMHAKQHSYNPLKSSLQRIKQQLNLLNKQQKQIVEEIKKLIDTDPELKDRIEKIDKIKGIGLITIITVLAETNGFALVESQKQLASYAGLDVVQNQSGLKTGKTSISKKGNRHLRKSVYMPALAAIRCNQKFKELYIRLVIKKNNKKIALIAVARKLLLLIYTIWKKNEEYIPNYKNATA
jgi:transposase